MIGNKKDFITLEDFSAEEIQQILDKAIELKNNKDRDYQPLKGRVLGMIFSKASTRTRVSFETGIYQLGGVGIFLSSDDIQINRGETIEDTARVLERYIDCIMIRTFKYSDVEDLARYAHIPVINGLTDLNHPCQVISDFQTIYEKKGKLKDIKLAYIGDCNNMARSLVYGAQIVGMKCSVASPEGYISPDINVSELDSSLIMIGNDPEEAAADADIIYTDVWVSMGQEKEREKKLKDFQPYQVNEKIVKHAKDDYLFFHCLPAHRGEEVSADIIDGSHSVVFDQAENRLHAQKAVMYMLMQD